MPYLTSTQTTFWLQFLMAFFFGEHRGKKCRFSREAMEGMSWLWTPFICIMELCRLKLQIHKEKMEFESMLFFPVKLESTCFKFGSLGGIPNLLMAVFFRFSTVPEMLQKSQPEADIMTFIKSTFNDLEGPYHCWINKVDLGKGYFNKDGPFLVLAGILPEDTQLWGHDSLIMIETVKLLQQRYPQLNVMGFQCGKSVCSAANKTRCIHSIMKEYITFPILLSNQKFIEMTNGSCYMLFKDSESPIVYLEKSVDLAILIKGIEDLNVQQNEHSTLMRQAKGTSWKQIEATKEPYTSMSMRNLLLYFPSCISVDECGHRVFLSDSNHHRIVVFDGDGKILDCIGSSPGFEDGDFDSAKLARPAASFYSVTEDCLYVADSENHAIRRADMKKQLLETLYPSSTQSTENNGFLAWIMSKLGMERKDDARSEESDFPSLMFPWHLMQSYTDSLLITNRSFEMLWTMNLTSGKIGEVVKGFPKIREIYGQLIAEKLSHLRNIPHDWLQQQADCKISVDGIPYVGLMSSIATLKDQIMICDTVGHRVVKFNSESGIFSSVEFSNFGVLGLPYWLASSLERVYAGVDVFHGAQAYHLQSFSLFPGRVDIKINIDIPVDAELLEPLQDGCIWRQARGAATIISEEDDEVASINKSGLAQQWYDELDTVAFETPESESALEEKTSISKCYFEDDRLCINCAVNSSPGTSEVIIYAALYLKLKKNEYPDIDIKGNMPQG